MDIRIFQRTALFIFSIGYKLSIKFGIGISLLADQLKNGEFLSFIRGRVRSMDIESETTGSKSMPNISGCFLRLI